MSEIIIETGRPKVSNATGTRLTQAHLTRRFRWHVTTQLYDGCRLIQGGSAIYSLLDPRTLREVRYIGQTSDPARRFRQHLQMARLWLPDQRPWWIKSPKMRPLYEWIRQLYADDGRLPTMIVREWVGTGEARVAERAQICALLADQSSLLNVEPRLMGEQRLLL
jgi:hypothetical protein